MSGSPQPLGAAGSSVAGGDEPRLLELTIGRALADAAGKWGDREALVSAQEGARLSFAELNRQTTELATGFLALGLRRGDRIGIWSPNCVAWLLTQYAAARAGLLLVTINPAYRSSELNYALRKLGVRALVAADRFKTSDYPVMVEELLADTAGAPVGGLAAPSLPDLRVLIKIGGSPRPGWLQFDDVLPLGGAAEHKLLEAVSATLAPGDAINVQFTSGTTGLPKGATLSHRNILNNGYMVGHATGIVEGDRVCIPVPLYHCFGMVMGNLACLTKGATAVYPSGGFDPEASLATVAAERCTQLYGVPTMFIAMLGSPTFAQHDLSSLRGGIMAGAPCPVEVMREVIKRMNMRDVTIAYGMTETSPVSFQTARDGSLVERTETVGRVQPHLECKLVDSEGATVATGETGELCTRGYSVMSGYWADPEQTAAAIDTDGWMHSGDLATIDEEGLCRIVGRSKDMVIRGGENIYPREIEEFLYGHPDIEDVAVVGVADARFGEELCAWIRLRGGRTLTAEDVTAFCRDRISHYKIPRYVRFVDAFPMTATGKVQKYLIRERMNEELDSARA